MNPQIPSQNNPPESFYEKNASWIVIGLMAFSTFLSFVFFQKQSLRLDESQSLWQVSHTPLKILNIVAQDVHVPLYHMMLYVWELLFGNQVATARLLSLLFFLLTIPMIYLVGKLCYNKHIGLYAALILAISPFTNWYGNEIRMYSLFLFVCLVNQYFFIKIFKTNTSGAWWGFAVSAAFGIYTHYFFLLILATEGLFYLFNSYLFQKGSLKRFIWIAVGLFILLLPWLVYVHVLGNASNSDPTLPIPTSVDLFNTFSQFLFGFQTDHLNTILVSLWPLTVFLVFLSLKKNRKIDATTLYFLFCFILPNAITFVVSFVITPVYLSRYLIFTIPSMYLLLSWLFSTYSPRLIPIFRIGLVLIMLWTLAVEALGAGTPVKENYRGAAEYLEAHASASDIIALSAPFTIYPVTYYYNGPATVTTLPVWDQDKYGPIPPFSEQELETDVTAITADHDNIWLLLSYDQGYQDKIQTYFDGHYQKLLTVTLSSDLTLYEYKLRY